MKPNNLEQDSKKVRLLKSEKGAMKDSILNTPAFPKHSPYFSYFTFTKYAGAAVALLLLVGTPFTYAAQQSAPGDTLYAIERNIIEPLQKQFSFSHENKVLFEIERLEERLEELQHLEAEGELTEETLLTLSEAVEEHSNEAFYHLGNSSSDTLDNAVIITALTEAHAEEVSESGLTSPLLDSVTETTLNNLEETISQFIKENESNIQEFVASEIQKVETSLTELEGSVITEEVTVHLEDASEEILQGNTNDAFESLIDARIEIASHQYLNDDTQ